MSFIALQFKKICNNPDDFKSIEQDDTFFCYDCSLQIMVVFSILCNWSELFSIVGPFR